MKLKLLLCLGWLACVSGRAAEAASPDILANLRPEHPRLLLTTADWAGFRARRTNDDEVAAILT